MSELNTEQAENEIDESLKLCKFCMRLIGLSFEAPKTATGNLLQKAMLALSVMSICYHVFSEIAFIGLALSNSPKVEEVVPLFHTFGYGALSIAKVFVLWYKKDVFAQLIQELVEIWPVSPLGDEAQMIKSKSLTALRITSSCYFAANFLGIWFYNATPIAIFFYQLIVQGRSDAQVGFVWVSWYPFDKHQPLNHVAVYIFEMFAGQTCVWIMIGTDLLFSAMASHICLLLRLLQRRLEAVANSEQKAPAECYKDIVDNIKLHQRLIRSQKPIAFTAMKFTNISLVTYSSLEESSLSTRTMKRDEDNIYLPKLQQSEMEFLRLVSSGDNVEAVKTFLANHPKLNINCMNHQGETALMAAVQSNSKDMVKYLLSLPNIDVGDNALRAVRDNNVHLVEILLDALKRVSPGLEFAGASHSTEYPSYVTPLILAAQLGYYEMVAFLLSRGHTIPPPHPRQCQCVSKSLHDDPLYTSTARLATYRAISSPVYLIHEAADQILAAFLLSAELAANADAHLHFAAAYLKLRDQVSTYAVDLIGCCRTSEEVELILMQTSGYMGRRQFELPRLLMAMDYKQMEFVAHPHTQQVLQSHWHGDWYSWNKMSTIKKAWIVFSRILITPFILLLCVLAPRHRLVRHWRIPLNKLITHASAYFVFLALVFHISNQNRQRQPRGPPNTGAEAPLVLYVCGYTWSAIRMCLMQGPRRYFSKMWNWAEVLMLGLFGLTFTFWIIAGMDVTNNDNQNIERRYWSQYDPTLLAEGTFCLATIIAFFRLMQFCQLNYHLGPLQVSLGKMTIDIYKYIIVFTIIISAFAAGLARFYQYYEGMVYEDEFGMKTVQLSSFTSLPDTLKTLFWALFCMAPLESADVVLVNTQQGRSAHTDIKHRYTERVGYFCFGCFEVISVIVVLNMLIATMSNTFQRVNDNVAIEWTFGRTEVYIDYMWQTTLASPLNMVPTAAAMSSVLEWLRIKICGSGGASARWSLSHCCYIEHDLDENLHKEYPALMTVLLQRYFKRKANPNFI
ncbi:hypothetical protein O0L34_g12538 [Tuta absoluta]|nr:hypothetical protein O0L34_g12538 [Tuta absoluta]